MLCKLCTGVTGHRQTRTTEQWTHTPYQAPNSQALTLQAVCCKACNVNLKSYLREPFKIDTTAQKHHVPYLRVQHTAIHHITQSVPPPNSPTESSSSHKHTHALYLQSMEFKFRAIDERTTPCRSSPSPSSHSLSYFSEQALRGPVRSTAQWPLSSVWLLKYKTRKEIEVK